MPEPSPFAVRAASIAAQQLNRYPDPLANRLRDRVARLHGVDPDQILIGAGSDEFLFLLAAAYEGVGCVVCCADPAYWGHDHPALLSGAKVVKIPLRNFRHDLVAMAAVKADIAFVCNPHNPTGTCVTSDELSQFISESRARLIVVDEAYIEFIDDPKVATAIPMVVRGDVAVMRTFSKFYGLAGARVGYLIAPKELISVLRTVRPPFSVTGIAEAAALAALDDHEYSRGILKIIHRNRAALVALFEDKGFEVVPSQANFLLVRCANVDEEQRLMDHLRSQGIAVRPGSNLGLAASIRVTVPSDDGLALLTRAIEGYGDRNSLPCGGEFAL